MASRPTVARRAPRGKARVPDAPSRSSSIWEKLTIPAVIVIAVGVMVAIPFWGFYQSTILPGQEPLATVRGEVVQMDQLVRRLRYERAILELRQAGPEAFTSVPMQAVFDLVDLELIRQGAEEADVVVTNDDLADAKVAISRQGLSGEEWSDIAAANAVREKFDQHLQQRVPPRVNQVKVEGFTLTNLADADESLQRIEAGESIAELASELSSTKEYADNGGAIGWVAFDIKDDGFDEVVFAVETPGEIVGPINTIEGFFVGRVIEPAQDRLVDGAIQRQLQSSALRRWLSDIRKVGDPVQLFWDSDKYAWANDQVRRN